jgi:hypothetical protein
MTTLDLAEMNSLYIEATGLHVVTVRLVVVAVRLRVETNDLPIAIETNDPHTIETKNLPLAIETDDPHAVIEAVDLHLFIEMIGLAALQTPRSASRSGLRIRSSSS